ADIFHTYRKPDERICNTQFFALLFWNGSMCHECRMIDKAFHAAQTFRQRKQVRVFQKTPGSREITFQDDRYDSSKAAHLLTRQIVLRMGFQPRVTDGFYLSLFLQPARDLKRIRAMSFHSERQGF